ncbi:MAG: hypothetical protein WCL60_01280 [Methylococcales bacterium]
MSEIRLAYINHLRGLASGHKSDDMDLIKERVLTERVDRELKLFTLAEKKSQLINMEQLRPEIANAFLHIKTSLRGMTGKLKALIDARYDIDFDVNIITNEIDNALTELARHVPSSQYTDEGHVQPAGTAKKVEHTGLG